MVNELDSDSAKCFVISAPSGAGKTTLVNMLMDEKPDVFYNSVSDTTREKRDGEVEGVDYNFISVPEFNLRKSNNEYLEWAPVHNNFYGTLLSPLVDAMNRGVYPLMILDVQGYFSVREKISCDKVCSVFILPPSLDALVERIKARGDSMPKEVLELRIENAKKELSFSYEFDYRVCNDVFRDAYREFKGIVESEM
jgi:guanylate kinase